MPFGQCPALEVDGKMLAQSNTIARYLARQHGLAGKSDWEQAQADMYVDSLEDVLNGTHAQIDFDLHCYSMSACYVTQDLSR